LSQHIIILFDNYKFVGSIGLTEKQIRDSLYFEFNVSKDGMLILTLTLQGADLESHKDYFVQQIKEGEKIYSEVNFRVSGIATIFQIEYFDNNFIGATLDSTRDSSIVVNAKVELNNNIVLIG